MYSRTRGFTASPLVFSGLQMLVGGIVLAGSRWPPDNSAHPLDAARHRRACLLTVFGSGLAYAVYNWLIHRAKPSQLGTTAYVNPAVALMLGWSVLGEVLHPAAFPALASCSSA